MLGNKMSELGDNSDCFTDFLTNNLYEISTKGSNQ